MFGGTTHPMITKGQQYITRRDIPVIAMTSWSAPFTGGYDRILRTGEAFTVLHDPQPGATAVYCKPNNYRRLHGEFIPFRDRWRFWVYRGFYLCVTLKNIEESCEIIAAEQTGCS